MKFWNTVQINRKGPLIMLAYQTGFFAFGVAMVLGINTFLNKDMDYACMGSLMAAIGIAVGIVARGGTSAVRFRLAVMMGQPRRSFLLWDTLNTAAVAAMGYLVSWIFYQTELALYRALYPGYACQISMDKFFAWPVPLAVIPTICVLDLAIGVLQVRFGAKAAAVIWIALCLTPAIVGQAVRWAASGRMTPLARLGAVILGIDGALTPGQWALAGAAALASVTGMSIWGYWGAEVRG